MNKFLSKEERNKIFNNVCIYELFDAINNKHVSRKKDCGTRYVANRLLKQKTNIKKRK